MNFGGCTLCDLQSSVLLPSKDGILLKLIGFWLYSVNLLDVVAGSPAFTAQTCLMLSVLYLSCDAKFQ